MSEVSPVSRIARKEVLEMVRDGRFRWAGGTVVLLLLVSLAMGWSYYRDVNRQHLAAQASSRQQWESQGTKNPHSAAHYGVYAFKPKMPLTLVDRGTDAYTGVAVWLEAHKQNDFRYRPAQDANALQRFGELTASTVLQLLVPLLIILVSFSAFSGERESGTLRQLLSMGLRARDIVYGKALGACIGLGLLLIPAAIIGTAALVLTSGSAAAEDSVARGALLAAAYLLYFAAILGISLGVSARTSSSNLSLVILLALWVGCCLLTPRVMADVARSVHPTPSAFEFMTAIESDIRNGVDGHNPQDVRTVAIEQKLIRQYGVSSTAELPVNLSGVLLEEGERYGNMVFDRHFGRLWDTFDRQNRLHESAGLFSPLMPVRALSMGLSGTDFTHHRAFASAAEAYRRSMLQQINSDVTQNSRTGDLVMRGNETWKKIPDFSYSNPSALETLYNNWASAVVLLLWVIGAMVFAAHSGSRVRVA